MGLPSGSDGKESSCNARDPGSIPGSGRSPGERNGLPTPVFLPGEFHRGAWRATVHRVVESQTRLKCLSTAHMHHVCVCMSACGSAKSLHLCLFVTPWTAALSTFYRRQN